MAEEQKTKDTYITETYRVKGVGEAKCWTYLNLEGGSTLQLRRIQTNRDLVARVVGKDIKVTKQPGHSLINSYIESVFLGQEKLYPTRKYVE